MTARDRNVLLVLLAVAVLGGFWFLLLAPKRSEASSLSDQIAAETVRLQNAQALIVDARKAERQFDASYATVARLGKAVPVDDEMPSLVYQLEKAARNADIDFQSIKLTGTAAANATPAPPAATDSTSSGSASDDSSSSGSSSDGGSTDTTTATPAAPTQAAVAALPPGASVGTAGLPTMPFTFVFTGSYFDMEGFLDRLTDFIEVKRSALRVQGRLLTIDGISLKAGPKGFPDVTANIAATAFLLPAGEGLTNGATASGPASTTAAEGTDASSSSTAPSALITGASR